MILSWLLAVAHQIFYHVSAVTTPDLIHVGKLLFSQVTVLVWMRITPIVTVWDLV